MRVVSKQQLISIMKDALRAVEDDDSAQGTIHYDGIGFEGGPEIKYGEEFIVHGAYRIGNQNGQGGVVLL